MDKNKKLSSENIFNDNANTIRLVIAVLLAFFGTYFNMPARGLLSTLPILLIASLFSVLIKIPIWQKAVLFAIFGYFFTLIDYDNITGLIIAAFCVLMILICSLAFYLFKKKKVLYMMLAILLIIISAVPQVYFFGNYPEGKAADDKLKEYIGDRYTGDDVVISGIHYDYNTGYYAATIYNKALPTDIYSIAIKNNHLHDSYIHFAEQSIMYNQMLALTKVLRDEFENDRFDVSPVKISGYPFSGQINLNETTDYNSLMKFKIVVPGLLNKKEFEKKSREYLDEIMKSDFVFNEIVFVGSGLQADIMTITVTRNPLICDLSKLTAPPANFTIDEKLLTYSE